MTPYPPSTRGITDFVANVIAPLFKIDRTLVMPFDLNRHENVGEHSASIALLACALLPVIAPELDSGKVAEFAVVHDIAEIYAGDVTVWDADHLKEAKANNEKQAADRIAAEYPDFPWLIQTYTKYESLNSNEARYVYALDKIYPHLLIIVGDHHPVHPSWEAYQKTELVARQKIEAFPALLPLFDELCVMFRQKPGYFSTAIPQNEIAADGSSISRQTRDIIDVVAHIITPLFEIPRTMVMPFDLQRHENAGEHDVALALLACSMAEKYDQSLDTGKIAQYAITHEIAKIHTGDVTVWESDDIVHQKVKDSTLAAQHIAKNHPAFPWIAQTYLDYVAQDTPEKLFVNSLDKMLPHLMILIGHHHPVHPSWEAYKHTENVAREKIAGYPSLLPLFDELCAQFRQNPDFFSTDIPATER